MIIVCSNGSEWTDWCYSLVLLYTEHTHPFITSSGILHSVRFIFFQPLLNCFLAFVCVFLPFYDLYSTLSRFEFVGRIFSLATSSISHSSNETIWTYVRLWKKIENRRRDRNTINLRSDNNEQKSDKNLCISEMAKSDIQHEWFELKIIAIVDQFC